MKLQINKSYLDQYDQQLNIVRYSSITKLFYDEDNYTYDENGRGVNNFNNLFKEVRDYDKINTSINNDQFLIFFNSHKEILSKEKATDLYVELHKFLFDSSQERNNTQDKETII